MNAREREGERGGEGQSAKKNESSNKPSSNQTDLCSDIKLGKAHQHNFIQYVYLRLWRSHSSVTLVRQQLIS